MTEGWHALRFVEDARKVAVRCGVCDRPMWLPRSKVAEYLRCGPGCASEWKRREREKRRRACETCGQIFYPRPGQIADGRGRFCSQRCNTAGRAALQKASPLAAARWRELNQSGGITRYRGPDHPQWKGGKKAAVQRAIADGRTAAQTRRYRKANPDKFRGYSRRRSDRKRGRLPRGTIQRIAAAQRWKCAICAVGIKRRYHVDHIKPLARGGEHVARNIQLLCVGCNVRKQASDPIKYMQSLGRLL